MNTDTQLLVFTSKTDVADQVAVPDGMTEDVLAIMQWVYDKSNGGTLGTDVAAATAALLVDFTTIDSVDMGAIGNDGTRNVPAYLSFQITTYATSNYIKVWFEDTAFLSQYDEYTIRCIGPVSDFSVFHTLTAADLLPVLDGQTKTSLVDDFNTIEGDNPATRIRAETFTWVDPADGTTLPTVWGVAIYGQAGNNIDNIRRALIDYVLTNSTYTREQWVEVLPDMFRANEFIITPRWDVLAIPTESLIAGVYSPSTLLKDINTKFLSFYPDYPTAHVTDYSYLTGSAFNDIPLYVVGGPENKDLAYDFLAKFPDYTSISPSSPDFSRMSTNTQTFIRKLLEIITAAEDATSFSQLPTGVVATINRITRNNKLYISTSHDGVEYMVVTKTSYNAVINPV